MGAGKTTVGTLVAGRLGVAFQDTDSIVEGWAGKPVQDIFVEDGEDRFRELERAALSQGNGKALRRNIVVSGGSLATLIEQPFQIGTVLLRGLVPRRLQHLSIGLLTTMRMPSGIGAQILTEGDISLGDEI